MTGDESYEPAPAVRIDHPDWSRNATIYQINTRHFTPEGTFDAARQHLPRLRDLGVVILWLMPVHEIGAVNRKGGLGSPYAVRDHRTVHPDLGTLDDLRTFVTAAHDLGMYVILDWVGNHTAWDHVLVREHPEWYARDWKGDFRPTPWWDWDDIIDLDYDHPGLRRYMTEAMAYWVREADVDGYRCDVAGFVPVDFWNGVRRELDAIKPVFMLAEWETRDLHRDAFDMTYAWSWYDAMRRIATGGAEDIDDLIVYYAWNERAWPADAMRMTFVTNHDKNAWEGTKFEQFGEALDAAIVLSVVGDGMPLLFNGQEAGIDRRLDFLEDDAIEWGPHRLGELYRRLFALKREVTALWNGRWGATMIRVPNDAPDAVLSFVRHNEHDKVFAVFNLSPRPRTVSFGETLCHSEYRRFPEGEAVTVDTSTTLDLAPWSYLVLVA